GHREILRVAAARVGEDALALLPELWRGNDDEDVHIVPLLGLRLQAVGFTHTHRPGSDRGELFAPSARVCCTRWAVRAEKAGSRGETAYLLGRACHLLIDIAVPARSRGVWHFYGDPLESWVEAHVGEIAAMEPLPRPTTTDPGRLCEELSCLSAAFPADTTRSTWGAWRMRLTGGGTRVSEEEAGRQARVLVPAAVAHVTALVQGVLRR
ncbi:MAG: hypothetical protein ABI193_07745, partial [Minicystis sp.]